MEKSKFVALKERLKPMKNIMSVLTLLMSLSMSPIAFCWEEAGHYYSVQYLLTMYDGWKNLNLPKEDINIISFCTQLPDEASELDAANLYFALRLLKVRDTDFTNEVFTVEQISHGLTGGNSTILREVAERTIKKIIEDLNARPQIQHEQMITRACALGFALHLYGDSFAHRDLDNESKMYPTGRGHGLAAVTNPDHPLLDKRRDPWKQYMQDMALLLKGTLPKNSSLQQANDTYWDRTVKSFDEVAKLSRENSLYWGSDDYCQAITYFNRDDAERICDYALIFILERDLMGQAFSIFGKMERAESKPASKQSSDGYFANWPDSPTPGSVELPLTNPIIIPPVEVHELDPCEVYVQQTFDQGAITFRPDCRETWKYFKKTVSDAWQGKLGSNSRISSDVTYYKNPAYREQIDFSDADIFSRKIFSARKPIVKVENMDKKFYELNE